MMKDCMLDLETFGTRPGCVIRSVGAAMFDPRHKEGLLGETFYMNVDRASCEMLAMRVDPQTEAWWRGPKMREANEAVLVDPRPAREVAAEFCRWWSRQGAKRVWSQGGNFDEPIMTAFLEACGQRAPWKFWDARCTRTAYAMGDFDVWSVTRDGTHHNALDDCRHQIICVQRAHANIAGYVKPTRMER